MYITMVSAGSCYCKDISSACNEETILLRPSMAPLPLDYLILPKHGFASALLQCQDHKAGASASEIPIHSSPPNRLSNTKSTSTTKGDEINVDRANGVP